MSDVEVAAGSTLPATVSDDATGLEDFGMEDMVMPRLKVIGKEALYEDSLTGEKNGELRVVILGLVKQRILWDAEMRDGQGPLCRSNDFAHGNPDDDNFPFGASGFDPNAYPVGVALPCEKCALKEWGSHPKNDTPWCAEQFTFPLLIETEVGLQPAVISFQRSALKPCRAYVSGFQRTKSPLYTSFTTMTLQLRRNGTNEYSTPVFTKSESTDEANWPEYASQYRAIRHALTAPRDGVEASEDSVTLPSTPPTAPAAAAPEPPTATPVATPPARGRGRSAESGRGRGAAAAPAGDTIEGTATEEEDPPF